MNDIAQQLDNIKCVFTFHLHRHLENVVNFPFRSPSWLRTNICLTLLVFINAVRSAAMRGKLHFIYAFEMNLPLDHTDPTQLSEMALATEKILDPVHPTDPTAGQFFIKIKKKLTDILWSTDTHKALQEHYGNSAESMSMDRTVMDIDMTEGSNKHIDKATVMEDISSQEMDRPEENRRYRPPRTQMMLEKHNSVVTDTGRQNLDFMKEMDPIIQSFAGIKAKLNYAANKDTLNDSRELADRIPGCTETSVEHPTEENNSLDAPNVDQKIQKDTMSYQNQLR
uniref:Zgc:194210 n=1 Tax=Sinocyclocheilus rhinocerous TaxID=307959 RepID=A0A673FWH7_9TELE